MIKILVLYYTKNGSVKLLANEIAMGIESVVNCHAVLRTVPALTDNNNDDDEYATIDDLYECDGLALGSPVYFGNMAAPLKHFFDSTTNSWMEGTLVGKVACVFTSSASLHGGQESCLLSMMIPLLHHGMILCGLPYDNVLSNTTTGGSPYGVTHLSSQNVITLSEEERSLSFIQGVRLAKLATSIRGVA